MSDSPWNENQPCQNDVTAGLRGRRRFTGRRAAAARDDERADEGERERMRGSGFSHRVGFYVGGVAPDVRGGSLDRVRVPSR